MRISSTHSLQNFFTPVRKFGLLFGLGLLVYSPAGFAQQASDTVAPEFYTGKTSKALVKSKSWMISSANPYASKTGRQILKSGGNAVDAMVAVQLVLGLVEPQSSGLGGGAFLVYWDAKTKSLTTFDGRETAPSIVDGNLFIGEDGKPMRFFDAVIGGRSVGTPGTVKLLETVHKKHGKLGWQAVIKPAIDLAQNGFKVSNRLNSLITRSAESLFSQDASRAYFMSEEGVPLFPGTKIVNQPYADTLKSISASGAKAFYTGVVAQDIVDAIKNSDNPGFLSLHDLANYTIKERKPVCVDYRGFDVCGMGPPSSGALTVGQILKIIEPHDLAKLGPASPQSWRIIGDASRLAFADRGKYMADSDFVTLPKGLLNKSYMSQRAGLIAKDGMALQKTEVVAGDPPADHALNFGEDASLELPSTSHFSIVDKEGNVVSMTTTIENGFGSRLMVRGFLLNNELTDFSFKPTSGGKPVANRVEGSKRPRSSMAPTIILKDGKPYAAIGSPGGSRIIGYVAKTVIAMLDWKMDVQQAIELPHLVNRFGTYDLEKGTAALLLKTRLEKMGYKTKIRNLNSGIHAIQIHDGRLTGGADPRREGLVLGE